MVEDLSYFEALESLDKQPKVISHLFDRTAHRYDLMNDLMSGFTHRPTRHFATRLVRFKGSGRKALDLATGTGDFAFLLSRHPTLHFEEVVGLDFSPQMLAVARSRSAKKRVGAKVQFVEGDILNLPFPDNYFDVLTIGYAIRNVVDVQKGLREILRVTRPGGTFLVVEATPPLNKFWRFMVYFYFAKVVSSVAKVLSSAPEAYSYFTRSVSHFYTAPAFAALLRHVGWSNVRYFPRVFGSATIFQATKQA